MAATDLLTLVEGYRALNDPASADRVSGTYTPTSRDIEIGQWISGVSQRVDDLCGPVVAREKVRIRVPGRRRLLIDGPVRSVTSLTYGSPPTTVDPATYELETTSQLTVVHPTGGTLPASTSGFTVTWQAGRVAATADVPEKFKLAAGSILRRLHARDAGAWARGGDPFVEAGAGAVGFFRVVDPMVAEFLESELLAPAIG